MRHVCLRLCKSGKKNKYFLIFQLRAKEVPATGWFEEKSTIVKALVCIFNVFTRRDIRIEMTFPGTVKVFGLDMTSNAVHDKISDVEWKEAYLSSILRAFDVSAIPDYACVRFLNLNAHVTPKKEFPIVEGIDWDAAEPWVVELFKKYMFSMCRYTQTVEIFNSCM